MELPARQRKGAREATNAAAITSAGCGHCEQGLRFLTNSKKRS
jgi:hypothetical protein